MAIGQRVDAVKIKRGVGGKAFPSDYNWVCSVCGQDNRSWADFCQYCEHEAQLEQVSQ